MKAAVLRLLNIFLILLLCIGLLCMTGLVFSDHYVILNAKIFSRNVETLSFYGQKVPDLDKLAGLSGLKKLDLQNTDLTLGEHEWLARQLPDCEILWQVPFQDHHYSPEETRITVSALTDADVIALDDLKMLREVDAMQCRDYDALAHLMERRPECRVLCAAELGGKRRDQDTMRLDLRDADLQQVEQGMKILRNLKAVHFTGILPPAEDLLRLREKFPKVHISWQTDILGKSCPDFLTHLDLSCRVPEDPKGLAGALAYFPDLESLDFRGSLIPNGYRIFLEEACPQADFLWDCVLDGVTVPADTKILDLSGHRGLTVAEIENVLPYLPELEKLILCDCGLSSEELAELNGRLEKPRIIWNVSVGGRNTRTDEVYFASNKWGLKMTDENIYDLRYCTDMVCVDIGHSHGVTNCQWAEFMPELRYLIIADSNVRGLEPLRNLKKLQFLELFMTPDGQDLSPLEGCTALEDLNLCHVYAEPEPVSHMPWLKRLWWSGCWPAKNLLEKALPETQKNFTIFSSTGAGWREGKLYYEMRDFIGMGYMKG